MKARRGEAQEREAGARPQKAAWDFASKSKCNGQASDAIRVMLYEDRSGEWSGHKNEKSSKGEMLLAWHS